VQPSSGYLSEALHCLSENNKVQTPAMVVRRSVYEQIGMFDRSLSSCEDWEMWVRIATQYPVAYCALPLAEYRMQNSGNTVRAILDGSSMADFARVQALIRQHNGGEANGLLAAHREGMGEALLYDLDKLLVLGTKAEARKYWQRSLSFKMPLRTRWRMFKRLVKG